MKRSGLYDYFWDKLGKHKYTSIYVATKKYNQM